MAMTTQSLKTGIARAIARMASFEQELNEADARLGDGDTGTMLANVIRRFADVDIQDGGDVGEAFRNLAKAAVAATGSSLGTLLATGLLAVAKQTSGEKEVAWERLSSLLATARNAMLARGGSNLGDKTVLDALDAAAEGAAQAKGDLVAEMAVSAAAEKLELMRPEQCKIGRARMFAEKSRGMDDPGMLAFVGLAKALRER